jgi:hypothetical protein
MTRSVAVPVEVQPLPHLQSSRHGESSSSAGQQDDTAYATDLVFEKLVNHSQPDSTLDNTTYIAIEWPEERRIAGKGKTRSLVIQLRRPPAGLVSAWLACCPKLIELIF